MVHLVRDLLVSEVDSIQQPPKGYEIKSYRALLTNNCAKTFFTLNISTGESIKGLFVALRVNTWIQQLVVNTGEFLGKVDDFTQDNFSLLKIKIHFSEMDEAAIIEQVKARNSELKYLQNLFELCEGGEELILEAYESLIEKEKPSNMADFEYKAFFFASARGHVALVRHLLLFTNNPMALLNQVHPITAEV